MGNPRFGLLANIGHPENPEDIGRVCRAADRLGYDSLAFGDHLSWPIPEAWTVLAWAGGITDRIDLTHLVLNNTYRHPSLLARMGASIDFLSDGRFELGIGAGTASRSEYRPYGFAYRPFAERIARLEETLAVIGELWEEGKCSFEGDHYHLQDASLSPKPIQNPRPPVLIGGQSDELMNLATEYEGWNFGFDQSPDACRRRLDVLRERSEQNNQELKSLRTSIGVLLLVAESQSEVEGNVRDMAAQREVSVGEFRSDYQNSFVGTPDELRSRIEAYLDVGVEEFYLWGPSVRDPGALELFATEVMSELR